MCFFSFFYDGHMCVCVCVYACVCLNMFFCVCVCMCMYVCACVHIGYEGVNMPLLMNPCETSFVTFHSMCFHCMCFHCMCFLFPSFYVGHMCETSFIVCVFFSPLLTWDICVCVCVCVCVYGFVCVCVCVCSYTM